MTSTMLINLIGVLLFLATSTWVLIDSIHLGIAAPRSQGAKRGFLDYGPAGLFAGCLLLWIVVFPAYLVKRRRYLTSAVSAGDELYVDCPGCGTRLSLSPGLCGQALVCPNCRSQFTPPPLRRSSWYRGQGPAAIAWALYAIVVSCTVIHLSRVGVDGFLQPGKNLRNTMTKAAIERKVREGIQERMASNPATVNTEIKTLSLTQENEGLYRGTVLTQTGDRPEELEVSVAVEDGQIRWQLLPRHAAEARSLEWNQQDPDAVKNGNIAVALQKLLRNPDCKTEAEAPAPALVVKTVSGFYGKPLKLSGKVYGLSPLAADSKFGKAIGGKPGAELLLVCSDKTVVDMLCTTANPSIKAGDSAIVYGFVAGTTPVPNPAGGVVTRLVMVGSACEQGAPK